MGHRDPDVVQRHSLSRAFRHRERMRRRPTTKTRRRAGLTLFELLLALSIFLVSLAALAQLLASGSRAAAQAKLRTEAILRCEAKMGEIVAGVTPIEAGMQGVFADDPRWSWRSTASVGPWPHLQLVELRVSREGQQALSQSGYTLKRYVRDPRLFTKPPVGSLAVPAAAGPATRLPPRAPPAGAAPVESAGGDSDR